MLYRCPSGPSWLDARSFTRPETDWNFVICFRWAKSVYLSTFALAAIMSLSWTFDGDGSRVLLVLP